MNTAYKHLDNKLRISWLTAGQWCGVICGVSLAIIWGVLLHPLPGTLNTIIAVYLGGIPALLAYASSETEIDLWMRARAVVRWRRAHDRYLPGAGDQATGYVVRSRAPARRHPSIEASSSSPSLDTLWQ